MKARDIMSRYPEVLSPGDAVGRAMELMAWAQVRHLPVVEDGVLVGLVSERDLVVHRVRRGDAARDDRVGMIMQERPQTASPDDSVTELTARMAGDKLDCLPVVELGRVVGIVTVTDVLRTEVADAMAPRAPELPGLVVGDVMSTAVETAHPDDHLVDAAARMQQRRFRHLPVIDGAGRVIGMLSDTDVRAAFGDPTQTMRHPSVQAEELRVQDAMTTPPITTEADRPLAQVAREFVTLSASAVSVVDAAGTLIGILSYVDVLRGLTEPH